MAGSESEGPFGSNTVFFGRDPPCRDLLGREIAQQQWQCYAYCLMNNHYHLLLETPEPNLSQGMRRLNGVYAQDFNRRHHRVGHLMQGRFKSVLVDKESYLLELCRYLVMNPVRAKAVAKPEEWPWSSYAATVGRHRAPDWLSVPAVLSLFAGSARLAQAAYREFVREGIGQPSPWSQVRGQVFLGDEEFLEQVERLVRRQHLANVPAAQTRPTRLTPKEVLTRVRKAYGVALKEVISRSHPEAYQCAVWLLRRAANEPLRTVALRFGVSPSRVSHIQRTLETGVLTRHQRRAMIECKIKGLLPKWFFRIFMKKFSVRQFSSC